MKKYVSFIGSLLLDKIVSEPNEEQKTLIEKLTEDYCKLAYVFGQKLTSGGHLVKVGSFSELDASFASGAIDGANRIKRDPKDAVIQIVGGFTQEKFLSTDSAHIRVPIEDDFISGKSAFIYHAKAIVLLGGHHYAKMLASWGYNLGIPVLALPQGHFAGEEMWKYLIAKSYSAQEGEDIFPGITRQDYEQIGVINAEPEKLASKLYGLIEKSSLKWVKPAILPEDMRYKPSNNHVEANVAFVAMSLLEEKNCVFDSIKRSCSSAGFKCIRGDNRSFYYKDLSIMTNVTESIVRAHVVIVDLSDRNPNVFYELGVADTLGKTVILLFDGNGDVPFDVRGLRHLRYTHDDIEGIEKPLSEILTGFSLSTTKPNKAMEDNDLGCA